MKNLFYSGLLLTATLMAACSSEDNTGTESQKGMTLYATVSDTRATMTEGDNGNWKFAFSANDVVKVGNNTVNDYYTFTNNGTNFTSSDAKTTSAPTSWYAYFPSNEVSLAGQSGDFSGVANYYALSGSTTPPTTGAEGLSIHLTPQVAVLRIVKTNNSDQCDINVKMGDKWVSSLTAKNNEVGFNVTTSTTKVSLLYKNGGAAGIYYVAVPAGVKIAVYNGGTRRVATKEAGLTAGKYYTVTTSAVSGKAEATINGTIQNIDWVQLWAGGPKFATENVAKKMSWTEAAKTGDNYVWGKNWRTPTSEDVDKFIKNSYELNKDYVEVVYTTNNGVIGYEFTGVQPGYTKNSIFLPVREANGHIEAIYQTSTLGDNNKATTLDIVGTTTGIEYIYTTAINPTTTAYYVRPVLAN